MCVTEACKTHEMLLIDTLCWPKNRNLQWNLHPLTWDQSLLRCLLLIIQLLRLILLFFVGLVIPGPCLSQLVDYLLPNILSTKITATASIISRHLLCNLQPVIQWPMGRVWSVWWKMPFEGLSFECEWVSGYFIYPQIVEYLYRS